MYIRWQPDITILGITIRREKIMEFSKTLNEFGDFGVVGKDTQRFIGKLVEQEEQIVLECYVERELIDNIDDVSPQIINGDVCGQKVTLLSAYCMKRNDSMVSKKCTVIFSPNEIIVGKHYSNENFLITHLQANYTDLENWFMSCVFKPTRGEDSTIVKLVKIDDISIRDKSCQIHFNFGMNSYYKIVKKLVLTNQVTVEFIFENPTDFIDARTKAFSLRNLLLYFAGEYLSCNNIKFKDEHDIECCYHMNFQENVKRSREFPYPITYLDIKDCFQEIWNKWIDFEEKNKPLNNLFFEAISNHSRWSNQFLNLLQALETYSRREREKEAKKVFKEYKEKDPIKEKKLSLKHRMIDIFRCINGVFELKPTEIETIAVKTSDTRNYYTHYSKSKKSKAFELQDFGKVNRYLQAVLIAIVLNKIGVEESCIIKAIKQLFFGTVMSGIRPYLK